MSFRWFFLRLSKIKIVSLYLSMLTERLCCVCTHTYIHLSFLIYIHTHTHTHTHIHVYVRDLHALVCACVYIHIYKRTHIKRDVCVCIIYIYIYIYIYKRVYESHSINKVKFTGRVVNRLYLFQGNQSGWVLLYPKSL